jgi:sugar lactone lactonase YvrE
MPDPKLLLTGLVFPESPRWHGGRLWLADWGAQEIIAVDLEGKSEVVGQARQCVRRSLALAAGTRPRRRLSQAAERSLNGRRRSSVFWIAGGTYAWSRVPISVPGGTISSI